MAVGCGREDVARRYLGRTLRDIKRLKTVETSQDLASTTANRDSKRENAFQGLKVPFVLG